MSTTESMSKEDWIIVRLIREALRAQPFSAPDHLKAIKYLAKKYGRKQLDACIDQLNQKT